MGKKSKRNKSSANEPTSKSHPPLYSPGAKFDQPPIEPGRTARVHGLVNRSDLNGELVTIKEILESGRVAVEMIYLRETEFERREVISIEPVNLEVRWNKIDGVAAGDDMKHWGQEEEECPICCDSIMDTARNAIKMECCGAAICKKCLVKTQRTKQKDSCPMCRSDTSDTSDAASVRKIRARADRGDANAMYNLGAYYDTGAHGVEQDQALARVWFAKAAEKGDSRAAHNLACSYRDGEGGPVDNALAAKYFRIAAEKGHVQATTCLGIVLMNGIGVERDMKEAKKYLTKGANAGDELAVQQLQILDMMNAMGGIANMSFSSSPGGMSFSFGK